MMLTGVTIFLLFFTHLAGQSLEPVLTWPVYALWLAAGIYALLKRGQIAGPGLLLLLIIMASVALNGIDGYFGYRRVFTLLGYMGMYYFFQAQRLDLARGLAVAGTLMSLLVVSGVVPGNPNVVAAFIALTAPAAMSAWWPDWGRRWYTLGAGAVALAMLASRGAWLAASVGVVVYLRQWWALGLMPLAALGLVWMRPYTVADRLFYWQAGLRDLSFVGKGFGSVMYSTLANTLAGHTHCLPLTVAVETGAPGLAALGWGVWRLIPRLTRGWQGATLAGLLAWSLIDEVIWFWGAGMVAAYLISEVMRDADDA